MKFNCVLNTICKYGNSPPYFCFAFLTKYVLLDCLCRYADALVGSQNFYDDKANVETVIRILQTFSVCREKHDEDDRSLTVQMPSMEQSVLLLQKFTAVLCSMNNNCTAKEENFRQQHLSFQSDERSTGY
jgi:hypothetical protein